MEIGTLLLCIFMVSDPNGSFLIQKECTLKAFGAPYHYVQCKGEDKEVEVDIEMCKVKK